MLKLKLFLIIFCLLTSCADAGRFSKASRKRKSAASTVMGSTVQDTIPLVGYMFTKYPEKDVELNSGSFLRLEFCVEAPKSWRIAPITRNPYRIEFTLMEVNDHPWKFWEFPRDMPIDTSALKLGRDQSPYSSTSPMIKNVPVLESIIPKFPMPFPKNDVRLEWAKRDFAGPGSEESSLVLCYNAFGELDKTMMRGEYNVYVNSPEKFHNGIVVGPHNFFINASASKSRDYSSSDNVSGFFSGFYYSSSVHQSDSGHSGKVRSSKSADSIQERSQLSPIASSRKSTSSSDLESMPANSRSRETSPEADISESSETSETSETSGSSEASGSSETGESGETSESSYSSTEITEITGDEEEFPPEIYIRLYRKKMGLHWEHRAVSKMQAFFRIERIPEEQDDFSLMIQVYLNQVSGGLFPISVMDLVFRFRRGEEMEILKPHFSGHVDMRVMNLQYNEDDRGLRFTLELEWCAPALIRFYEAQLNVFAQLLPGLFVVGVPQPQQICSQSTSTLVTTSPDILESAINAVRAESSDSRAVSKRLLDTNIHPQIRLHSNKGPIRIELPLSLLPPSASVYLSKKIKCVLDAVEFKVTLFAVRRSKEVESDIKCWQRTMKFYLFTGYQLATLINLNAGKGKLQFGDCQNLRNPALYFVISNHQSSQALLGNELRTFFTQTFSYQPLKK